MSRKYKAFKSRQANEYIRKVQEAAMLANRLAELHQQLKAETKMLIALEEDSGNPLDSRLETALLEGISGTQWFTWPVGDTLNKIVVRLLQIYDSQGNRI